jgi:pimeloyl-ACP methyl ester carboxylesterase
MIIDVNGFQLHYEERGGGDPLLLLHGGTGSGHDWQLVFTGGVPEASERSSPTCADMGARRTRRARSPFARLRSTCSRCSIGWTSSA